MQPIALFLLIASAFSTSPVVQTENGLIQGTRFNDLGVEGFYEIPFASAPVGALRWRAPRPQENWHGIRDASSAANKTICPQVPFPLFSYADQGEMTEDCLKLNVIRPILTLSNEKLPVLVWIHGGGNWFGGIHNKNYDPSALVKKGKLIVVQIAYRLNVFGVLAHEGLHSKSLNLGLQDVIAGLEWIQANIENFNGDPKQVTISGQSAGAGAVLTLMTSPLAKNLFRGVIAQSPMPGALHETREAANVVRGQVLSTNVGCTNQTTLQAELSCMRSKSWQDVLDASWVLGGLSYTTRGQNDVQMAYGWINDGYVIKHTTALEAFQTGDFNKVELIIGGNNEELTFIFNPTLTPIATETTFKSVIQETFGSAWVTNISNYYQPQTTGVKAFTDLFQNRASDCFIDQISKIIASKHTTVYRYLLTHVISATQSGVGAFGCPHYTDVPLLFDTEESGVYSADPVTFTSEDRSVSNLMESFWTLFIYGYQLNQNHPSPSAILKFPLLPIQQLPKWTKVSSQLAPALNISSQPALINNYRAGACQFLQQLPQGIDLWFPA